MWTFFIMFCLLWSTGPFWENCKDAFLEIRQSSIKMFLYWYGDLGVCELLSLILAYSTILREDWKEIDWINIFWMEKLANNSITSTVKIKDWASSKWISPKKLYRNLNFVSKGRLFQLKFKISNTQTALKHRFRFVDLLEESF